jgi:WD domain, G-beta repeat
MFGAAAASGGVNPNKDVQVTPALNDGVSSLSFSPRANILVATCWDNNAYVWEVAPTGAATAKASTSHTQPVLCSAWNADGSAVFTGSCDKTVKMWHLATNQSQQVAAHDAPVRHCAFIPETNLLVTGACCVTTANTVLSATLGSALFEACCPQFRLALAVAAPSSPPPSSSPLLTSAVLMRPSCLLQAAGTRRFATGTAARPTQCSPSTCLSAAMRWTCGTRCWWWGPQTVTFLCTTSPARSSLTSSCSRHSSGRRVACPASQVCGAAAYGIFGGTIACCVI